MSFVFLQKYLPQHLLSAQMNRIARSTNPTLRNALVRFFLRNYPMIDMREAAQPDPFAYASFNEFFTRALKPGARPIDEASDAIVSPVDGTVSQVGLIEDGQLLQAKGVNYSLASLLADAPSAARFAGGSFACIYLAPYNYHRIHMPLPGRLLATRYVPGALFSVNAATAAAVEGLFAINERVVCEFETPQGALAMVLVGALMVGSIETRYAGEINPPGLRRGQTREITTGRGTEFGKGDELGRFNMGSTVILAMSDPRVRFTRHFAAGAVVRLGQAIAHVTG
jgi:phosphatidylserine decarboxylase